MNNIAAVVVGYHPDLATLDGLLESLLPQVALLVLVDNGGAENYLASEPERKNLVHYIPMGSNKGLGAALNLGFKLAIQEGMEYVVTFDQDSHVSSELIDQLYKSMKTAFAKDDKCIAVSPVFYDCRDGKKNNFPFYQSKNGVISPIFTSADEDGLVPADVLITSGMFVRTEAWIKGIKYDDGMFVDFTDSEWCFRVRHQGYSLYGCLQVEMGHELSDAPPVKIFGLSFFRYSPVRRYFFFRNTVAVARMQHTPAHWKKRMLSALVLRFFVNLLIDKHRFASLKMMLRGIWQGARGSLGPLH